MKTPRFLAYIGSTLAIITILGANVAPLYAGTITTEELFFLVNQEREQLSYSELKENPLLTQAAELKAEEMFVQQRFAHDLQDMPFYYFVDEVGYNYKTLGENLAIDYTTPSAVVQGWMNSPLHKANILNTTFEDMGIAVVEGSMNGINTTLVVQVFGSTKDSFVDSDQLVKYYESAKEITQTKQFGMAAIIAGTATVEGSAILSFLAYKVTHRRRKQK